MYRTKHMQEVLLGKFNKWFGYFFFTLFQVLSTLEIQKEETTFYTQNGYIIKDAVGLMKTSCLNRPTLLCQKKEVQTETFTEQKYVGLLQFIHNVSNR